MQKHSNKDVNVNIGIEAEESIHIEGVSATATKFGESFRGIFRWRQSFFKLVIAFLCCCIPKKLLVSNVCRLFFLRFGSKPSSTTSFTYRSLCSTLSLWTQVVRQILMPWLAIWRDTLLACPSFYSWASSLQQPLIAGST
jgi:hypothetical protein